MRKMKLFLTATAVICALPGCAGKIEVLKDQTQAASEIKTEEVEEAGKETGKSENTGEIKEAKRAEAPENGDLFTCLIFEVPAGVPFTDLTWTGFKKIENEYGARVKPIETFDKAEYPGQVRVMAEMGANPIYTMFDTVNEVVVELAPEYPKTMLCLIDSSLDTKHDNAASVYVDSLEPAFASGPVATRTTQSGTTGWIGSLDILVINRFRNAYLAGAKHADPDVAVRTAHVGGGSDTIKVGEQTKIMVSQGADTIFQTANLAGLGVIQGCSDTGIKCIGMNEWQGGTDGCVFWSSSTDTNRAMSDSFTVYKEGGFAAGRTNYGIETQSAIYGDRDYEKLPDDMKVELDELPVVVRSGSLNLEDLLKQQAMVT